MLLLNIYAYFSKSPIGADLFSPAYIEPGPGALPFLTAFAALLTSSVVIERIMGFSSLSVETFSNSARSSVSSL